MYHICRETYDTYLIVMKELPQEEYRYMRCLCDGAKNPALLDAVSRSCNEHPEHMVYNAYFGELLYSVEDKVQDQKKDNPMCEAIFEIFGTSSQEIAEKAEEKAREEARKENQEIINDLTSENSALANENSLLRTLLAENGIPIPVL